MFADRRIGMALVLPALFFIVVGFILPVGVLLAGSFRPSGSWSFDAYTRFFASGLNQEVFWRTVKLGVLVTVVSAVVGYAAAFAVIDAGARSRGRLIGLLILPLMISPVARTYAWIVILGRAGLFNTLIIGIGLTDEPIRLLFTETAVFIGLIQLFLPLMILSLVSALENLPADVIPAARVLGASWPTVFWRVILPLTREGLVIGGTLVFTGSVTAYITPAVLGGSRVLMLETLLYQRINVANDVLTASVIAVILVALSYFANVALRRLAITRTA